MSERKAATGATATTTNITTTNPATTTTAPGPMDAKGSKVVDRSKLAGKGDAAERERDRQARGISTGAAAAAATGGVTKNPKKRRKERPCTRCIKRNIGHLCHDEPREADPKKKTTASKTSTASVEDSDTMSQSDLGHGSISSAMGPPPTFDGARQRPNSGLGAGGVLAQANPLSLVQPDASSGLQANALNNNGNANQFAGFSDAWLTAQNYNDMNTYNPNYMIGPDVTHEFNLLNDFLHNSILDEGGVEAQQNAAFNRPGGPSEMLSGYGSGSGSGNGLPGASVAAGHAPGPMLPPPNTDSKAAARSDKEKTREYYLQAADPSGNDNPEERMSRVLKAKYDAGLLKPFNYINGYARLGKYLDGHIASTSKQKILRTINQFRPKFREKAQGLTDMQLVYVEMWFEKQLMDYDRVFASMAVPACCWRRTGEIFRGNKEMAELINVPVDRLRDGKIALHEILTEESMVRYWEEFGTIAFDPAHDTLLTACSLKNPSDSSDHPIVKCCFSFTIRRDEHKLPALIVGNFLPHDPPVQ
ncbi:Regulator of drug sensitivity 2 [Trichoderma ghanense]|uniref:Regulator of drug sensitivity 2 n=1 Tax=Trichoderma ghanense TaxID=65468 RepID=A0ABY2GS35_9HYPO